MNENIDWHFANGNALSGLAFTNHAGPSNRTGTFYCLAIRKRKTQERQAHLSDESAIKPSPLGSFKIDPSGSQIGGPLPGGDKSGNWPSTAANTQKGLGWIWSSFSHLLSRLAIARMFKPVQMDQRN